MLELARQVRARILQASTSEVYGDPDVHPQSESYWGHVNPIGPRSCYDEGKRCAETLLTDYYLQNGIEIRIARIFNTYGPRMTLDDGRVVSNFAVQALKQEPLTIYGEGNQTRSFCYVDDTVRGLIALMNYEGEEAARPFNLGNPQEITIKELAERIIRAAGGRSRIVTESLPTDDPRRRRPDISRAQKLLEWKPLMELDDGLGKTVRDFAERVCGQK